MTALYQTDHRFYIGARAQLIDDSDNANLKAWAEKHVRKDKDIGWILGHFVEADNANGNGHIFPLADLETYGVNTVAAKPLNMLHHPNYVVGAFAGAEMMYPPGQAPVAGEIAADAERPMMDALSGMWRGLFPDEYRLVQKAHADGSLFYSMECLPTDMTCPTCSGKYKFQGLQHETYCAHLNASRISAKILHQAHFEAGAIIIPPVQPGWSRADITQLSELIKQNVDEAESLYAGFEAEAPHLDSDAWEALMGNVMLLHARQFTQQQRQDLAKKKKAMPGGGFPIENAEDLKNAIQAVGRAKDPAKAKAHIKSRAAALGLSKLIPAGW